MDRIKRHTPGGPGFGVLKSRDHTTFLKNSIDKHSKLFYNISYKHKMLHAQGGCQMITHDNKQYITLREFCALTNRTSEAVRTLIQRKVLIPIKIGARVYFEADFASTYYAKKKGLTPMETSDEFRRNEKFYNIAQAAEKLGFGIESLRLKIRNRLIRAVCSVEGEIFVPESALNTYFEGNIHDISKSV